jgi:hypothetical protein
MENVEFNAPNAHEQILFLPSVPVIMHMAIFFYKIIMLEIFLTEKQLIINQLKGCSNGS